MLLLLLALPALAAGQCQINLEKMGTEGGKYPPLIIQDGDFLYPTSQVGEEAVLDIPEAGSLELFCHGTEKYQDLTYVLRADLTLKEKSVPLTCSGGVFRVTGTQEEIDVEMSTCSRKQEPRLERTTTPCSPVGADGRTDGLDSLVHVSIGWKLKDTFVEQIGLCVDESNFGTLWTNHTVRGASIAFRDIDPKRPSFRTNPSRYKEFFPWTTSTNMNNLYSKKTAASTVTALLGGVTALEGETIIETSSSGTDYFAKGHLSPDAAFIYNVQQDATYYFINVAPQFQSFNNGNWKALEGAVRDLAEQLNRDLVVTTGTHEILEYPDKDNKLVPIFLARIESYIPAPQYYWKVVHDPQTGTAAAFIGLNDPHTNVAPVELCPNRCAEMSSWVDWDITKLDSGYMYCCSVEDAAAVIKSMPVVSAPGGLLGGSGGGGDADGSCQAGPCTCNCAKNDQGKYACNCTCKQ